MQLASPWNLMEVDSTREKKGGTQQQHHTHNKTPSSNHPPTLPYLCEETRASRKQRVAVSRRSSGRWPVVHSSGSSLLFLTTRIHPYMRTRTRTRTHVKPAIHPLLILSSLRGRLKSPGLNPCFSLQFASPRLASPRFEKHSLVAAAAKGVPRCRRIRYQARCCPAAAAAACIERTPRAGTSPACSSCSA